MRRSPLSALLRSFPWRPVPIALAMGVLCTWRAGVGSGASSRDEALVQALAKRGLSADATEVRWIDSPRQGLSAAWAPSARALVRASAAGDLADLYLVRAELSPSGGLVAVHGVYDLTRSPAADETAPVVRGEHALYATLMDGVFTSVHALDLGRDPEPEGRESATRLARAQSALTNYQDTGQLAGIGRRGWSLDPSSSHIDLGFSNDDIAVVADGHAITLPAMGMAPLAGSELVRPQPSARARPGNLVTWAVDRVRNLSWFGDDRMQTVKALTFAAADLVARAEGAVLADTSEKEIAADMGDLANQKPVTYTDPQTGWPPAPMAPYLNPPLPGEGQWVALDRDPFIQTNAGAPPAFVTSYVRTDRERAYTRIYVTVWDPRQVEMHMMAGTVEPVGASGEAGPGLIPRTPEVMRRVVGALNGGFQALHGEFGMMGDGVVYLPPKPYAATVADMRDGSTGFGEWPLSTDIPADILSYRQNLTALVLDEKYNPYGRSWWGGTPPGWKDKTHTVRTGICLTRENFIAYFYGTQIDAEVLAQAMIQARCKFGVHLDMNAGHTGLEFYRVAPAADLGNLGRALSYDWEAEGSVVGMDGWKFRARRMIRVMGLMNFPRYIQREARDFLSDPAARPARPEPRVALGRAGRRRLANAGPSAARLPVRAGDDHRPPGRCASGREGSSLEDRSPHRACCGCSGGRPVRRHRRRLLFRGARKSAARAISPMEPFRSPLSHRTKP